MKRRQFLKLTAATAAPTSLAARGLAAGSREASGHQRRAKERWRPRTGIARPNIVIAVLDDVGFGDLGCYGAEHRTRCIDAIAAAGVRFTNFHVTALCAPTRACLMTGRNAHAVGVGNIAEWGRDLPAYQGVIRPDAATIAEVLREKGYATLATGKWHLNAIADQNASGPFHQWPTGRGFDRWYGFHGNAMDHWHPEMFENTVAAYPNKGPDYHLSGDLVDRSIDYIQDHIASSAEQPFFLYLAFGACHYPLHVPEAYIEKQRGRYRAGWDAVRSDRFARQQALNVVPDGTRLAPRNPGIPAWQDLSEEQRRVSELGQEVYAAFLEHTDDQLARLIEFLEVEGELDDTLLIVMSDNGAAGGGGTVEGILDVRRAYYDQVEFPEIAKTMPRLGTEDSYGIYGGGWAQASNVPLKWYKADTHGGGTRAPLIVSWPNGGLTGGALRNQYTHVVDIAPTLLEMINETQPDTVETQPVLPMQGESFAHTLDHPNTISNKQVQYFETAGDRAVWSDGWKAVCKHQQGQAYDEDTWELYNTAQDFSEIHDLADQHPERLRSLILLWQQEAVRDGVLPMADDLFALYEQVTLPAKAKYVFFPGMTRLDRLSAPDIASYPARVRAEVRLRSRRANGVILASGDSGAGYELYLREGYLVFHYVYTRTVHHVIRSSRRVAKTARELGIDIDHTGSGVHRFQLFEDARKLAEIEIPKMWQVYSPNSGIRCGENHHSPISFDYDGPLPFEGKLERVVVELDLSKVRTIG